MTLTGLLLVGGLSRRMGRDKATLLVEGQILWAKQLSLLNCLHPQELIISARVRPPWTPSNIQVVLDGAFSCGPLSGLAAGLEATTTSHLLVLAVDLPRLTAAHLKKLLEKVRPGVGIIPFHSQRFEPLAAIYPKEAAGLAQQTMASNDVSLQSFARELRRQHLIFEYPVLPEEQALYLNLNSPKDVPSWRQT